MGRKNHELYRIKPHAPPLVQAPGPVNENPRWLWGFTTLKTIIHSYEFTPNKFTTNTPVKINII